MELLHQLNHKRNRVFCYKQRAFTRLRVSHDWRDTIGTFFYNKLSNPNEFPRLVTPVKPKPNRCKSALHTSCLLEVALSRFGGGYINHLTAYIYKRFSKLSSDISRRYSRRKRKTSFVTWPPTTAPALFTLFRFRLILSRAIITYRANVRFIFNNNNALNIHRSDRVSLQHGRV